MVKVYVAVFYIMPQTPLKVWQLCSNGAPGYVTLSPSSLYFAGTCHILWQRTRHNKCQQLHVISKSYKHHYQKRKRGLNYSRLVNNDSVKNLNLHTKSQRRYMKTSWNARFEVLTEVLLKIQFFWILDPLDL